MIELSEAQLRGIRAIIMLAFMALCVTCILYSAYVIAIQHFIIGSISFVASVWMASKVPNLWIVLSDKIS
jgi:hypothetical protein